MPPNGANENAPSSIGYYMYLMYNNRLLPSKSIKKGNDKPTTMLPVQLTTLANDTYNIQLCHMLQLT